MIEHQEKEVYRGCRKVIVSETEGCITDVLEHIGQNGLLCYTTRSFEEMTLLDMRFELPDDQSNNHPPFVTDWVQCEGVVVRCEPVVLNTDATHYEVAVYFSEISEENKNLLQKHVNRRLVVGG